jgi:hypothetical protein
MLQVLLLHDEESWVRGSAAALTHINAATVGHNKRFCCYAAGAAAA